MKFIILSVFVLFLFCNCQNKKQIDNSTSIQKEYYQLKTYTFDNEEQMFLTDNYIKDAYLPALKRLNFKEIGVFKSRISEKDSVLKTFVLIPFSDFDQILNLDEQLDNDSLYLSSGEDYINALYNKAPYKRIESTLMRAFEDMPIMKTPKFETSNVDRIYELRSYQSATEKYHKTKVDMFNSGEVDLFKILH